MSCDILLVEDDDDIREIVIDVLEQHGFHVEGAFDGADALRRLRAAPKLPKVIFLDLLMPIMDGAHFRAEQLRDPKLAEIPVVVMSALADDSARALAPMEFLAKPIRSQDLLAAAARACGKQS
jgi:CheY-like chemotaxis protein